MRVTIKPSSDAGELFNLLNLAYDLLQVARATSGLEVYVQDIHDGLFVEECPLAALLKGISEQLSGIVVKEVA